MCFRPGGADSGGIQCPECGKPLQAMGNMVLKKCPFCKCDLEKYRAEYEAGLAAGAGAPKAPGAPAAPGAPKPPAA